MELVNEYKLRNHGKYGYALGLPGSYIRSIGSGVGKLFEVYREGDKLILVPKEKREEERKES